jgi:cytochrome c553
MKRRLIELGLLVLVLAVAGFAVLASGIIPIKASSGHWPATRLLLDFASDRSISVHSRGIEPPRRDPVGSVTLGAATFDHNCRWCHGAPGFPAPTPASQMTPQPPNLNAAAAQWKDAELFYILKHGIKFAGMPAWAAEQRDEDIWPTVAFLRALPQMDQATYLEHIQPVRPFEESSTRSSVAELAAVRCAACHGLGGNGRAGPRVPVLAGQSEAYLRQSLQAYHDDARYSGIMQPIAVRLQPEQMDRLAAYYAARPNRSQASDSASPTLLDQGARLARQGNADQKIASCVDCHGPGAQRQHSDYPRLAGQPALYLQQQLQLFQLRDRGGTDNAGLMHPIADKLSEQQIEALAAFYASLSVASAAPGAPPQDDGS